MRTKAMFLLLALTVASLTISGCARKVQMTDLTSEELKLSKEAEKEKRAAGGARTGQAGKPVLYGDTSALGVSDKAIVDVLFDFDRYSVRADSRAVLKENAAFLKEHDDAMITLEGHCDERGTDEYNIALGERRANSVKNYLSKLGISIGRINTISYGEERPFCAESNEECWQKNRRVHFKVGK
ncbi:MAG: peptidoglycan-associated lipoprotein Pal [Thermodesulfobacteriota bacterium]